MFYMCVCARARTHTRTRTHTTSFNISELRIFPTLFMLNMRQEKFKKIIMLFNARFEEKTKSVHFFCHDHRLSVRIQIPNHSANFD